MGRDKPNACEVCITLWLVLLSYVGPLSHSLSGWSGRRGRIAGSEAQLEDSEFLPRLLASTSISFSIPKSVPLLKYVSILRVTRARLRSFCCSCVFWIDWT